MYDADETPKRCAADLSLDRDGPKSYTPGFYPDLWPDAGMERWLPGQGWLQDEKGVSDVASL